MKNKKLRRFFEIIGYIAILTIAALLVFVIVSNASGHTVFIAGRTTVWVMTASMEPEIPERSYILVRQVDPSTIEVGDVIMFRSDDPDLKGANNTHRVVEVLNDHGEFVTKGDASTATDHYTAKAEKVIGVYERRLPVLTAIGRFLSTSVGHMAVIAIILCILMMMYLPGIMSATRARTEELEEKRRAQIEERVREEVERLKRENREKIANAPPALTAPPAKESPEAPAGAEAVIEEHAAPDASVGAHFGL